VTTNAFCCARGPGVPERYVEAMWRCEHYDPDSGGRRGGRPACSKGCVTAAPPATTGWPRGWSATARRTASSRWSCSRSAGRCACCRMPGTALRRCAWSAPPTAAGWRVAAPPGWPPGPAAGRWVPEARSTWARTRRTRSARAPGGMVGGSRPAQHRGAHPVADRHGDAGGTGVAARRGQRQPGSRAPTRLPGGPADRLSGRPRPDAPLRRMGAMLADP